MKIHKDVSTTYEAAKSLCEKNDDRLVVTDTADKMTFLSGVLSNGTEVFDFSLSSKSMHFIIKRCNMYNYKNHRF